MQDSPFSQAFDIQEALKILRFRFRRDVGFRPVKENGGVAYYSVDGELRAESEILRWAEQGRMPTIPAGSAS